MKLERFYFLTTDSFKKWDTWRHHCLGESSPGLRDGRRTGERPSGSTFRGERPLPAATSLALLVGVLDDGVFEQRDKGR